MSDSPALERKFSMADETIGNSQWLARLWEWTSQNGIRIDYDDLLLCTPDKAPIISLVDSISGKCNKNSMRRGCHSIKILTKLDLLQADGITICANMRSGGAWDAADPEWTELVRAHLGWQAEDATAPFAITVPSATAAPGTLVKFRDGAGEQRIGIVRTATHMQNLPAAANQPGTLYSVLAANTTTASDIRACKIMADKLQPTTRAIEWHHRELAAVLTHDHPAMSKKDVRSCTNTRWRNLTDENKKPYLQRQPDDAAFKDELLQTTNAPMSNAKTPNTPLPPMLYTKHTYSDLLTRLAPTQPTIIGPVLSKPLASPSQ
jgi:hypothetical protein